MRIVGIGVDIIEIERVERMLQQSGSELLDAWFTPDEQQTLAGNVPRIADYIAMKESVVKALGTGFQDDVSWMDVSILRDAYGQPEVRLRDGALKEASRQSISSWLVSVNHCKTFAIANAIAVAEQ